MAHTKIGRNKKACEKYKLSGRRQENKLKKQERAQKRIEKFKKREEEGRSYTYRKKTLEEKRGEDGYIWIEGSCHRDSNVGSHQGRHGEFNKWKKAMKKMEYKMEKAKAEAKTREKKEQKHGKKNERANKSPK